MNTLHTLTSIRQFSRSQSKGLRGKMGHLSQKGKRLSNLCSFDKNGRMLLMSHESAAKYYKLNLSALILLFYLTNKMKNSGPLADYPIVSNMYLGGLGSALLLTFLMSNRHARRIYLHDCGS